MITITVEGENLALNLTMEASDFIEIMRQPEIKTAGKKALESLGKFGSLAEKFVQLILSTQLLQKLQPLPRESGDAPTE